MGLHLILFSTAAFILWSTVRAQSTATTTIDPCFDNIKNCHSYGDPTTICAQYQKWSEQNCQRYCGYCTPLHTTPAPACQDTISDCHSYSTDVCSDPRYIDWALDRCQRFCGFCTHMGFRGSCHYKGNEYSTGATWSDGCDYECECIDGQNGTYQCQNKCPLYYDIPSSCRLVQRANSCCKEVKCDDKKIENSFVNHEPGNMANGTAVCMYRQKQYVQGQEWFDGQDYRCFCVDASTGEYKCTDLCATYPQMPSQCVMTTDPLTNCQIPTCTFHTLGTSFTGDGHLSGHGFEKQTDPQPICADTSSNCESYGPSMCHQYEPWARDHCIKYCGLCNSTPAPKESDKCVYHGISYRLGERWNKSCDVECVCEDPLYGYYRCYNKCPSFTNIPADCQVNQKAGDCCQSLQCNTGSIIASSGNPKSIGGSTDPAIQGVPGQDLHPIHNVQHATTDTNVKCVDSTLIRCSDTHVCQDTLLKSYCPVNCGLCTPCTDSTFVQCSDSHVCSEAHLKNYCPVTCGLCGKHNTNTGLIFGK